MSWDQHLFLQDAMDARRDTISATKREIKRKANSRINWSYLPTEHICRKSPGGKLVNRQALLGIERIKHDVARRNNRAATLLLHPYFSQRIGRFYPVQKEQFRIGVGVSCKIRMLGVLHDGNTGTLYWNQYRKSGMLNREELGLVATVGKFVYLDDPEYNGFRLKLLDIGADHSGIRRLREYDISDLRLWTSDELNEFFDPVFQAIRDLKQEGFQPPPRKKGPPRPPEDQPGLFD